MEDEIETRVLFLIKFRSYSYPILLAEAIRFLIVISALSFVRYGGKIGVEGGILG